MNAEVQGEDFSHCVLILTPTGEDARLASEVLAGAGVYAHACADVPELCRLAAGGAGSLLVASEALETGRQAPLLKLLASQPKWSDLPVLLLTAREERAKTAALAVFSSFGSVTFLERPLRPSTLVSTVKAALRARERQYETRDLLQERADLVLKAESLAQAARSAQEEAEAANSQKDQFIGTVSHELRTPLNAILGWAKLLSKRPQDAGKGLEMIARNAKAQSALIEDLLDLTRISSGMLRLELEPVDLVQVVRLTMETVRGIAEDKGVDLREVLSIERAVCTADPNRIQQVLWNLLSNAIKFTPPQGNVEIALQQEGAYYRLSVRDTGRGIEQDFLPLIFKRFSQSGEDSANRHSGLGIGLSIVKDIVELHGGSVSAESKGKDQGSTFTVMLPRERPGDQ